MCGKAGHTARHCRWASQRGATPNDLDVAKVEEIVERRKAMRAARDFAGADALKAELKGMGVTVMDADDSWFAGTKGKSKPKPAKPAGACFAFQEGSCQRGDACHFRHVYV